MATVLSLSPHVRAETNQYPEILCTTHASPEFSIKEALGAQLPPRGNAFSNSGSAESTMIAPAEEPLINTTAYTNTDHSLEKEVRRDGEKPSFDQPIQLCPMASGMAFQRANLY